MVPRPSFVAKGVESVSIIGSRSKSSCSSCVVVGGRDGVLAGLSGFPCGADFHFPFKASAFSLIHVPSPRALATNLGTGISQQGAREWGSCRLLEPCLSEVARAGRRRRDFDPCRAVSLSLALKGE
jgi:hypothetical protein